MALNFIFALYLPWVETHGYKVGSADGTGEQRAHLCNAVPASSVWLIGLDALLPEFLK